MTLSRRTFSLGGLAVLTAGCAHAALPAAGDPSLAAVRGKTVLIPSPAIDFDPTEIAVPWQIFGQYGVTCVFATPDGKPGTCDPRMLTGDGLGPFRKQLRADDRGRAAYAAMQRAPGFTRPIAYAQIAGQPFDALVLPGGHAPGMRAYLESPILQTLVGETFARGQVVGAICHGVLLAARSKLPGSERSVLYGRRTTALLKRQEQLAWKLTRRHIGDQYYRTYPVYLEDEVLAALASPDDFLRGPRGFKRDGPEDLGPGFAVVDGNYVSARWPGDAHRFALAVLGVLAQAA